MNPLTNVKNITKLNERELKLGINEKSSWHNQYKDSAWLFIGGLPFALTEGDIICVFSQYGEVVNINLVRDKKTGVSKGFCFLCYENQKSTILAVDNLNAIKICGRTIRVDHVANYKPPKEHEADDTELKILHSEGCAPKIKPPSSQPTVPDEISKDKKEKKKKVKKKKKHKKQSRSDSESTSSEETRVVKKGKHKKRSRTSSESSSSEEPPAKRTSDKHKKHFRNSSDMAKSSNNNSANTEELHEVRVKKERHDPEYDKYLQPSKRNRSPTSQDRRSASRHNRSRNSPSDGRSSKYRHTGDRDRYK